MLTLALALAGTAHAQPITYAMEPSRSWLFVKVYNDTTRLASRLGHDHAVRAMDFTGTVVWDASDASACDVAFSVPVASLEPDPPGMRERAGLDPDGAVGASGLKTIGENFRSEGQLDAERYPTITFRSTSCDGATGRVTVHGVMTMRGVDVELDVSLDVAADDDTFTARGQVSVNHTDFGFEPFRALGGTLRNQDRLDFVIDVVGAPR